MSCEGRKSKPHVAMFPSAGMGHCMPFLHLARTLAIHHGVSVTFINTQNNVSHSESSHVRALASSDLDIRVAELIVESPSVTDDGKPSDPFFMQWKAIGQSMDALEQLLRTLLHASPPVLPICAVITDAVVAPALDVTAKLNIPNYVLFTASAFTLGLMLYSPILISQGYDFSDENLVLDIPGFPPLPTRDIAPALKIKDHIFRRIFVCSGSNLPKASGIFINTFDDLETEFLSALRSGQVVKDLPPVYPVGPIFLSSVQCERDATKPLAASDEDAAGCLQWLDTQPANSVVYVSFGSRSAMSTEQAREVAMGLEGSGQRFLWVHRVSVVGNSATSCDLVEILPAGFQSRVKGRGLVVSCWVPQVRILSHRSTGGFVSHCGWNSVVESISYGIPVIAWPLFGDQIMNMRLLVDITKAGIWIKKGEDGIVSRHEVERAVRSLMVGEEGKALRRRTTDLRESARRAIEGGGSSEKSLKEAVKKWNTSSD